MIKRETRKKIKNWFIYISVLFFVKLLRSISRLSAIRFMRFLAGAGYKLARHEREKTIRHLTWAFGDQKSEQEIVEMSRKVFLHFGTAAADAIRMPNIIRNGINNIVSISGREYLDQALDTGTILLTGHFGNWEILGAWMAQNGYPIKVVGTSAYDPRLDRMIVETRNMAGYENIARGKGTREIIRHLRNRGFLGILIDQDTRVEGVFVNFFNRPAHTAVGPAVLAKKLNLSVVSIFIHLLKDLTYHIEVGKPLNLVSMDDPDQELVANVQICSNEYEKAIRKHPEQWVWMHERWKKKPETV